MPKPPWSLGFPLFEEDTPHQCFAKPFGTLFHYGRWDRCWDERTTDHGTKSKRKDCFRFLIEVFYNILWLMCSIPAIFADFETIC